MHPLSLSRDSVYGAAPFASLHWIERPKINLSILWSGSPNEHPIEVKSRAKEQFVQLSRDTGLAAVDNVQPCFLAWLVLVEQSAAQYVSLGFKYWWSCRCHNSKKAGFLLYHFSVTGKDILPRPECQRHARGSQAWSWRGSGVRGFWGSGQDIPKIIILHIILQAVSVSWLFLLNLLCLVL